MLKNTLYLHSGVENNDFSSEYELQKQKTQIDLNKLAKRQEKASIIEKLEEQIDEERSDSDK